MEPLFVGILDDHALLLESIALGLATSDLIEVVGTYTNLADLEAAADELKIDVLVADLELGPRLGTEVIGETTRRLDARVLLMSGTGDVRGVTAALDAGCSGFISKGRSLQEVIAAVLTVGRGGAVFPNDILAQVMDSGLTPAGTTSLPSSTNWVPAPSSKPWCLLLTPGWFASAGRSSARPRPGRRSLNWSPERLSR